VLSDAEKRARKERLAQKIEKGFKRMKGGVK